MKYAYYPGCSLEATAKIYDSSTRAVCSGLGVELVEIAGWNCCGASSGHSTNRRLALALAGRNLALAEKTGLETVIACPACYRQFKTTEREMQDDSQQRAELAELLGIPYEAKYDTRHLLDIIYRDIGLEELKRKVTRPFNGLKLACYYGCYLVRPQSVVASDDRENPRSMDVLLDVLGAQVRDWPGKVDCCGGSLSLSKKEIASQLVSELADMARSSGARALVTACPLCHSNLEMRQERDRGDRLPVFYFTELIGLAMGMTEVRSWLKKHLISPFSLLDSCGL